MHNIKNLFSNILTIFLIMSVGVTASLAQVRKPRNRYKPRGKKRYNKKSGNKGTSKAVGSAKDDPHFNECKNVPSYRRMKVTLKPDSKLVDLVGWISSLTCKRFIMTKGLRAQEVTIYSPSKVTPYEAYKAFLSTLEAIGLTVVKSGKYYKIVDISTAKGSVNPLYTPGKGLSATEKFITAMFRVKHADIEDVAKTLDKFKSRHGSEIVIYKPTNLLVITDLSISIKRLKRILKYLDVEGVNNERIWVEKIKNGDASEIADKLKEIFDVDGSGSKGKAKKTRFSAGRKKVYGKKRTSVSSVGSGSTSISKIMADERTNNLIIKADDTAYLQIMALLRKLDVPLPGGEEKIHIIYLENADAEDMSGLISSITGGSGGSSRRNTSRNSRSRNSRTSRSRSSYRSNRRGSQQNMQGIFKGPVQVQADHGTNSLVVVASSKDFLALRKIIKELDKPRRQVFIEVTIMEVSIDKTRNLGLSFHGGNPLGEGDSQSLAWGGTVTNSSANSIMMNPLSIMGLAVGLRGPEIQDAETLLGIPGISFPSFGVFFQALQSNNAVNVISSPHILTTNNEEAEIMVGENVPFQSGMSSMASMASAYTGGAAMPMTSIQRQDVVLKLKLTPHVNKSDYVRIEIDQEINEVKSIDPIVGPTTSKRKAATVVVVKDQQTVVIGGLMTEKLKTNVTKVPILGDLPIFGYLFKSTIKRIEKTNLLIFITPYIIRDSSDLRKIFQEKINQRKEFIEKFGAFKDHDITRSINYKHKVGLFEEINRTARLAEKEIDLKRKAMEEYKEIDSSGPVMVDDNAVKNLRKSLKKSKKSVKKVENKPVKSNGGKK
jgi:general secretion pathway protein D